MRRVIVALLALAVLGGGGAGLWYFQQQNAGPSAAGGPPRGGAPGGGRGVPVEAEAVTVRSIADEITAIGTLRSNESVVIRPEIAGRIVEFNFEEGRPVAKGTVLVQFDDSVARAELASAEANAVLARANAARSTELFARGAGSARTRDEDQAALRSTAAAVELAKARLDRYRILAPFDGIVGLRRVSPGDFVQSGADVVNIESIDPIKVDFRVPETLLASLRQGQHLDLSVDAFPGRSFPGTVYAIDPAVEAAGRAVVIRATLPNPEGMLRPGLFARVSLSIEAFPDAVMVPETAIVSFAGRVLVMKVVDGKVATQPVTTGLRIGQLVQVKSGLAAGDVVITAGHMKVQPGMPVAVTAPPAAQPAPAPRG